MSAVLSRPTRAIRAGALLLSALITSACTGTTTAPTPRRAAYDRYPIVPWPSHLVAASGEFRLDSNTRVVVSPSADSSLRTLSALLLVPLRAASGLPLPVTQAPNAAGAPNVIAIRLDSSASLVAGDSESYKLVVTPTGATLSAAYAEGLVNGVQTLRQLLPAALEHAAHDATDASNGAATWIIPAVEIEDAPRFPYRGILLDVARYYFPPEFLKQLVDLMSLYKFNALQLHLTDDQGWRIEIKKYPKLTQVGAWRKETVLRKNFEPYVGDAKPHGGFYTQKQMRDLVAYASARNVTIIPEIEMPGHAGAALAAYPELSCTGGPFEVSTVWGVHEDIFCPSEQTFSFLEDVLTEVMQIFPSEYIHIGGDEAPKTRWKASPVAQDLMKREGLKNEDELQSYLTRRIERFLHAHGRKLIGWDEILQGGIAPEATAMSWRGVQGGIDAARQGHDVIMSPADYTYLDHYQGDTLTEPLAIGDYLPLDTVYAFEPVPPQLTPAQAPHILGAQGNLWTEYISTPAYAEYMLFPRMLALADVVWSPKSARNRDGFLARLPAQFARLDALGVEYRVPEPEGLVGRHWVTEDRTRLALSSPVAGGVVRYTMDGSEPTASSARYVAPLPIDVSRGPVTVSARLFLPNGRTSPSARATIERAPWHTAMRVAADSLRGGLTYAYAEGTFAAADDVTTAVPTRAGTVPAVGLRGDERPEQYGVHLSGLVRVPRDALYTFHLTSDDGARLRVDNVLVVDHDGQHGAWEKQGQIALRAGLHAMDLTFFQAGGEAVLHLEISAPGIPRRDVPAEWFSHIDHEPR